VRVISGKYKGRELVTFKADHIRPTTDRVKESIFNKLQNNIDGARVLDLFSGTGSLAIEALSRGAESVTAVELNKKSIEIIRRNLELLKITEIEVLGQDVFKFLKKYSDAPFDLIFCDPPFTEKLADQLLTELSLSKVFHSETLIISESGGKETLKDEYSPLIRFDKRDYGDKIVSYFRANQ
jgi:16S rRNA (guanine966-N2)-methyltransferase